MIDILYKCVGTRGMWQEHVVDRDYGTEIVHVFIDSSIYFSNCI